ncbi:MAG TPA: hypothetical protein EYN93_02000, partial [Planctomycetaceae bacterium]|nr:hypothetical protein [Planctomycetaceae bacterium]
MPDHYSKTERQKMNSANEFPGNFSRSTPQWAIKYLLALLALIATPFAVNGAERLPNFVIIFSDDQGYEDVGCFGSKQI